MAINCIWTIADMTHKDADGGVILVHWSCVALSDGEPAYSATEGGKLRLTYDASASDFIPYADLTEANVLGWVYADLAANSDVEDETPEQAKARVEAERTAKVQAQIDKASSQSNGLPWAA